MKHLIGFVFKRSGTLSVKQQTQELLDYGVNASNIHDTLEGITRAGEFQFPSDVLVVWEVPVIPKLSINDVRVNIARGGGGGIFSIKDKKLYKVKSPYTEHSAEIDLLYNKVEYKKRSKSAKGKAGARLKMDNAQTLRAMDLLNAEMDILDVAEKFKVGRSTVDRAIARLKDEFDTPEKINKLREDIEKNRGKATKK